MAAVLQGTHMAWVPGLWRRGCRHGAGSRWQGQGAVHPGEG